MKKRIALLSLLIAAVSYGEDEFFYEDAGEKNSVRLEESIISATGFESSVRNTPNNISIITREVIEEKNYTSVQEALKEIPSITIKENSFGSSVDMRGQGSATKAKANVQVLVDGVPLNPLDGDHGVLPLNSVDIESVEVIEVIPGGGAILYGGGTSGGVINIITQTGSSMKSNNYVKYERGSHSRNKVAASAGHKFTDDFMIQATYSGVDQDGYREGVEMTSDYYDITGKYIISDRQNISLKYARYEEESSGATNYLTRDELNDDRNQSGAEDETFEGEVTRDEILLGYNFDISDRLKLTTDISYQRTENNTYQIKPVVSPEDNETTIFTDEKLAFKPKLKYLYGEGSSVIVGYDFIQSKNVRDYTYEYPAWGMNGRSRYKFEKDIHAGFILNTYKAGRFEFTQGFRYEYADYDTKKENISKGEQEYSGSKSMDNQAYEMALNYLYSETGNTYIRWEQGFTSPAGNQLIDKHGTGDYRINNLESETYNTYEAGIRDYFLGSYVSLTAFYTIKEDEIFNDMNGTSEWYYKNIDETKRKGIEISAEQYLGRLTLRQSYTYIDAEISSGENSGNTIPEVAKNSASLSGKYDFTSKLNMIATLTYKDSYYLNEENDGGRVNDYITTDVVINYALDNGLKLFAGIDNLFNEKYYNDVDYDEANGEHTYDPADERTYYAGFKYNF